jgi:zinc-binding alcohol dehydrogenase/oxidoreductase
VRAVVLTGFGGAEVLVPRSVPDPVAPPGWVLVRLRASALNWHDVLVRQGRYGSPLPHIIGSDGAGTRLDTGADVVIVPSLEWGDRDDAPSPHWHILGDRVPGTYAEVVAVPEECLAPKPSGLTWAAAAALPLVGLTTYRALFARARLEAGEHLLITGAGGGVATMAVALATAVGARVTVTSRAQAKIDQAVARGAEGGVSYADADWPERARERTPDGVGFDVVLDSVGTWGDSLRALRPGGRLVVLGASVADEQALRARPFFFGQYDLLGTTMGSIRDFAGLLDLMGTHDVAPLPVSQVFPLAEAAEAHRYLESGAAFGKVVLAHG